MVSVVMAVFNGEKYLKEAVGSVLSQSLDDFEFIIIDDGSSDGTASIVRSFGDKRIKLISRENKGLAPSLNEGIGIARGKYVVRMDADDICMPDRFRKQIEFMEVHPECSVLGSSAIIIDKDGAYLYESSVETEWADIKARLPLAVPIFHSSTVFERDKVLKCGGYQEGVRQYLEDTVLWNRMARYGELRNLPDALIKYRLVPESISGYDRKTNAVLASVAERLIESGTASDEDVRLLESIGKKRTIRWNESNYYLRIAKVFIEQNFDRRKALVNLSRSLLRNPGNPTAWFNFLLLTMPRSIIRGWKRTRTLQSGEAA
jgi:glycosyltransferase involved in cell wall biosynthesis